MMTAKDLKPVEWVGSSYKDFTSFPEGVQQEMGVLALPGPGWPNASVGETTEGFGGAGVVELVEDGQHGTYRAVYTVKFENAVYVLHAFQKKSRKGTKTPREEIETLERRLRIAEEDYRARQKGAA